MKEQINLCDTCIYERESCESGKQSLGPGGAVRMCDAYVSSTADGVELEKADGLKGKFDTIQEAIDESASEKDIVTVTPEKSKPDFGNCSSCDSPLKEIKINTRVRATVCNNPRCRLFRERIKVRSLPLPSQPHTHQYKGKNNHCIVPSCNHIRIRRNRKGGVN